MLPSVRLKRNSALCAHRLSTVDSLYLVCTHAHVLRLFCPHPISVPIYRFEYCRIIFLRCSVALSLCSFQGLSYPLFWIVFLLLFSTSSARTRFPVSNCATITNMLIIPLPLQHLSRFRQPVLPSFSEV